MINNLVKPIFEECDKCIVLSSNNAFMPVVTVMLQSIAKNSKKDNKYDIIVLHEDITKFTRAIVEKLFNQSNISIRFYNVSEYTEGKRFFTENIKSLTRETYFRLLIPWILDDSYNYALYVDGDMVALKDIYDIFEYDLGNNLIGAVRDYWGLWYAYKPDDPRRVYRESISLTNIDDYIIGSTIIFNLKLFRKKYTVDQVLGLVLSKNWLQHDQDVINVLCKNSICHISGRWGCIEEWAPNLYWPAYLQEELNQSREDPIIVHFAANKKPWMMPYVDYFMDFWRYALETPFFKVLFDKIKSSEYKNYVAQALSAEKHGEIVSYYENNDIKRYFNGSSLGGLSSGHTRYRKISIEDGTLYLEGIVGFFGVRFESDIKVYFSINNQEIMGATHQEREDGFYEKKNIYTYRGEAFNFSYKLDSSVAVYSIKIICYMDGLPLEKTNLGFEERSPLSREFKHTYCQFGEWVVTTDTKTLSIKHIDPSQGSMYELAFEKELLKTKNKAYIKAAGVRRTVRSLKPLIKKPIWMVSASLFQENGHIETILEEIRQKKGKIHTFFVIDKNNTEVKILQQYGKVVPEYSSKHKILSLLADLSILSETDKGVRNPFGRYVNAYKDILCKVKRICYGEQMERNNK